MRPSAASRRRASITCSCNRYPLPSPKPALCSVCQFQTAARQQPLGVSSVLPLHTKNPSESHHLTKTDPPFDIITRLKELQAILFLNATRPVSSGGRFAMSHVTIPPDFIQKRF